MTDRGFESHRLHGPCAASNKIGGNLHFDSGRFINPNNVAISSPGATVEGVVSLVRFGSDGDAVVKGSANFSYDRVGNSFIVDHTQFLGARNEERGFDGTGMWVARAFKWRNVTLQNGAQLDLSDASVGTLLDDEKSSPAPGRLILDGLKNYNSLSAGSATNRPARFVQLPYSGTQFSRQPTPMAGAPPTGFHAQPYHEFAKYYIRLGPGRGGG